ncbi:hypothetical protein HAT2_00716 [Candidatus Similichlamydia laticola]|uniref:Uncharacterized protein n=1 Tax=Candidatus Similichlamydia laticola TaxID=2170265 RepID=A0A369KJT1_9BACT|nr:hypothetical protein HAT2_00716 [Candidatus Similichlamydia laticola]
METSGSTRATSLAYAQVSSCPSGFSDLWTKPLQDRISPQKAISSL